MSGAGICAAQTLDKEAWIRVAAAILEVHLPNCARSYAESLYQTFVVEGDGDCTPQAAIDEDMSYWEE